LRQNFGEGVRLSHKWSGHEKQNHLDSEAGGRKHICWHRIFDPDFELAKTQATALNAANQTKAKLFRDFTKSSQ
jgi:hypothetical protein